MGAGFVTSVVSQEMSNIFSSSLGVARKGLIIHDAIVDAYLKGLTLGANDKVLLVDILPNRHGSLKLIPPVLPKLFLFC